MARRRSGPRPMVCSNCGQSSAEPPGFIHRTPAAAAGKFMPVVVECGRCGYGFTEEQLATLRRRRYRPR